MEIYGTLGPSVNNLDLLYEMLINGMTGIRLNLSHENLKDAENIINLLNTASKKANKDCKLLIDLKGRELRIGKLSNNLELKENNNYKINIDELSLNKEVIDHIKKDSYISFDDGKINIKVNSFNNNILDFYCISGGILKSNKSIKIKNENIVLPLFTDSDTENIKLAKKYNVYGIMQPFVNSKDDVIELRRLLNTLNASDIKIFAKIENEEGFKNLESIIEYADEIIIARGDLGNAFNLSYLPVIQKEIEKICIKNNKPFMVVTEMLKSMENSSIPTRAEVLDIFNAVLDHANSIMVTSETAIGKYPLEVIKCLKETSDNAIKYMEENDL